MLMRYKASTLLKRASTLIQVEPAALLRLDRTPDGISGNTEITSASAASISLLFAADNRQHISWDVTDLFPEGTMISLVVECVNRTLVRFGNSSNLPVQGSTTLYDDTPSVPTEVTFVVGSSHPAFFGFIRASGDTGAVMNITNFSAI